MVELKTLSYDEKVQLLTHLGSVYRKGCVQASLCLQGMVEDCDMNYSEMELSSKIKLILRRLCKEDANILINDFFEIKKSNWWYELYSRSTYYRAKSCAMDEFLRCLYA